MLQLHRVSVVILAQSHNPSIISPDWVRSTLLIDEKEQNFIHTPPFSLFDSASFLLTVDADRWELVPKVLDDAHILLCGRVAGAYFRTLSHIPYKKLGLNYIWAYSPSLKGEHLPQISLKINGINPNEIFRAKSVRYGGTVEMDFKDYILKLTMNYRVDKTLEFNYNFSHDIQNWSTQKRVGVANRLLSLKARSQEMTNMILARKGMES
jgi:hypothetical protein